jgi:hypothetical protein
MPAQILYKFPPAKFPHISQLTRKLVMGARAWRIQCAMSNPRTDIFLARALEAVELAAATRSPVARAQWLRIAETYRELAEPAKMTGAAQKRESR